MNPSPVVLFPGKHLHLLAIDGWEYAARPHASGVVAVLAITDAREIILVEQFRRPVGKKVIELPAGLAGDIKGAEQESFEIAARRELMEETGYEARDFKLLTEGPASAGLTNETITFFQATGLQKTGPGSGDGSENIEVHLVPLTGLNAWLEKKRSEGSAIDYKIYAALFLGKNSS
jgi:ADP-ribose pyrophosphatase